MSNAYPPQTGADGDVTSWIPLTTSWLPSSACKNSYRLDGPSLMAYDPGYGLDVDPDVICEPPEVTTWWEQALLGSGPQHTAVSIGPLICPGGFSTVLTSIKDRSSTHVMCCPSSYYLANKTPGQFGGDCLSDVSSDDVLTYASTPESVSTDWSIVTTTLSDSSTVGAIAVAGWNINRPTTALTSTAPSPVNTSPEATGSPVTAAPSTTTRSTPIASSSAITLSNTSSGALPTGTKVGIGVAVPLGTLGFLALLAAAILLRRRQRTNGPISAGFPDESSQIIKAELPGEGRRRFELATEYYDGKSGESPRSPAELISPIELATEEKPLELYESSAVPRRSR